MVQLHGLGVEYFTEIAKYTGWNIVYQAGKADPQLASPAGYY